DTDTTVSPLVKAFDVNNNLKTDYVGTITFSTDATTSTLPANYTFTSGVAQDNGQHTFTNGVQLKTVGTWYVKVADGVKVGQQSNVVVGPGAIDHFTVTGVATPTDTDTTLSPLVKAYDVNNNLKTDYVGTITFSTDST